MPMAVARQLPLAATYERNYVYNVGSTALKVIGFFSSAAVVTTFDGILSPLGTSTMVGVADRTRDFNLGKDALGN
jgi:hypothetical protein